ncbi:hypothetical protein F5Y07DRAFT_372728 [Xylaria sp. FL0933]|nr:hypothetical protein F5Y07DRAFT_372728 [Xylaria sp. FL0933]
MSLSQLPHLPPAEQQLILNSAALEPPPGVTSTFKNPANNNGLALAVTILCLSVSSILLLIRAYTRIFLIKAVRPEDALAIVAFGNYLAYVYAVVRFMRNVGFFVHQWDLQVKTISEFRYILLIGANFYAVNILCIKLAIILEWLHIFVPGKVRTTFFWVSWAVLVVNTSYYIANIVALNLTCIPFRAAWDVLVAGKCLDQKALDTSSAAINLISDVTLIGLAQRVIWTLHMSKKRRLGLSLVFAAGTFGSVAGLLRLIVTVEYQRQADTTYTVSAVILWAVGEMTAGFLVFCVPTIPKAVKSIGITVKIASVSRLWLYSGRSWQKPASEGSGPWVPKYTGSHDKKHADGYPLTSLASNLPQESESANELPYPSDVPANGIVRTTHLVTTLDKDAENQIESEMHNRQHPWVSNQQLGRWDPIQTEQ